MDSYAWTHQFWLTSKKTYYNNRDEDNSPKTLNDENHQARGIMVIVVGNGHHTSSNPGRDWLHFT